jgi:hypothetical protein
MKVAKYIILFLLLVLVSMPSVVYSQKKQRALIDTLDNALDISYYLNNLHGLLPLVSPITEPAVGYGAAVAGLFFISKKEEPKTNGFKMPDIVGIAGGYTENGTWFAGGGYAGFWKDDHIRYRGVLGYGDIKLKYYGLEGSVFNEGALRFDLKSYFFLQQAIFRFGDTRFFLGGRYQFMKSTSTFLKYTSVPGIDPIDYEITNSGVGIIAEYENFNNIFSPKKGIRVNFTYDQYLEIFGSNKDFGRLSAFFIDYIPVISNAWHSGFRIESQISTGKTPFYMQPYVYLRGIPAMRYQGELTALVETEQEFILSRRWSLVGFGGYAQAFKDIDNLSNSTAAWNAGLGFRYLLARLFGLKLGIDVARGPEQWAVYLVFGSSWIK